MLGDGRNKLATSILFEDSSAPDSDPARPDSKSNDPSDSAAATPSSPAIDDNHENMVKHRLQSFFHDLGAVGVVVEMDGDNISADTLPENTVRLKTIGTMTVSN
jgi:hypothetical protein